MVQQLSQKKKRAGHQGGCHRVSHVWPQGWRVFWGYFDGLKNTVWDFFVIF